MKTNLIGQLKNDDNLALWHSYRQGHAADLSGNGYNGTLSGTVIRKSEHGMSAYFDGVDDVITVGNIGNVKSVLAILKNAQTADGILELINNTAYMSIAASALTSTGFTGPVYYVDGIAGTTVNKTRYSWLLVSSDVNIAAASFQVGEANGDFFAGAISDVLCFRRLISATEAAVLVAETRPWG